MAPSARTCAVAEPVPSIAVSVASATGAVDVSSTCPDVWPLSTVTPPPVTTTFALFDITETTVLPCAGPVSVTVSGVGNVAPATPTRV